MAATDRTRDDLNFQKKGVSVAVAPFVESEITGDGSIFFNLPPRSVIIGIAVNVTTVSTTASSTLDVNYNGSEVGSEIAVTVAGVIVDTVTPANAYSATGGQLVVKAGSTAPAAGDLVGEIIVQYIELDKNCGEYTTI